MGPPSPSLSRRASRPLPSPLSFTGACPSYCRRDAAAQEDLPRQGDIGLRAFAFAIELHRGAPKLGAPASRTLRGITVSYTFLPKCNVRLAQAPRDRKSTPLNSRH